MFAYDAQHYDALVAKVTTDRVARLFAARNPTAVTRYLLPDLHGMNFVLENVLDGGVDESLEGTRLPAADTVEYVVLPKFLLPEMQAVWDQESPAFAVVSENDYWRIYRRLATG